MIQSHISSMYEKVQRNIRYRRYHLNESQTPYPQTKDQNADETKNPIHR